MSLINPLAREISAKIVYYGPGLSGKTTSLKHLHSVIKPERRGDLITLATEGDRTLFFDFLPVQVDRVQDMPVRLQLYTVPGQIFYAATRKLVLNGADGVVFVADSQEAAMDSNRQSLQDLKENLLEMGVELSKFPHVFQYNKRDIPGVLPVAELEAELNVYRAPAFETSAARGKGVLVALKEICRLVVRELKNKQPAPKPTPTLEESSNTTLPDEGLAARLSAVAEQHEDTGGAGISFAALWPDAGESGPSVVEAALAGGAYGMAVRSAASALANMLDTLPGATSVDGHMGRAMLVGLDGREYLRLCRLASAPDAALTESDALFALYMLVAARIKLNAV
ncbi:MAG: GTPase domain-containing protein [Myxococcota bacterium]